MADSKMTPLARQVHAQLVDLMAANGLGSNGLARAAGVSLSTVSRVLNHKSCPSVDMVYKLFRALNVEPRFDYDSIDAPTTLPNKATPGDCP